MNLKKLKENLERTIQGKESLRKHLIQERFTVDNLAVSFLNVNLNELRLILLDLEEYIRNPDEL